MNINEVQCKLKVCELNNVILMNGYNSYDEII